MLLFAVHPQSTTSRVDSVPPLNIVAIIPARYSSTRLPGKALADLDGRPMIEHVYRLAEVAASLDCDVVVNVQGDEPLLDPGAIAELAAPFRSDPTLQMTTLFR